MDNKKYDPIFEKTYWARSCYSGISKVCENRNIFKEEFNIKCVRSESKYRSPFGLRNRLKNEINPEYPGHFSFDHFELYERNDKLGFVAIFSPYSELKENDKYYQAVIDLGYQKYHSDLYLTDHDCPTYYLLVSLHKK
tara:strand:- start:130 stop:543 length:414 start_codon:yes stop_codon:yes gene_type:complete